MTQTNSERRTKQLERDLQIGVINQKQFSKRLRSIRNSRKKTVSSR